MLAIKAVLARVQDRVRQILPEREFLHYKADVGMQVYRLTTRVQVIGVASALALFGYTGLATNSLVSETVVKASAEQEVNAMRAELASLRAGVSAATQRVEKRQEFLASLLAGTGDPEQLAALMPESAAPVVASGSLLQSLARVEHSQLAFVANATTAADARFENTQGLLRRLGLKPARFLRQSTLAMGGPEDTDTSPLANADPQFKALFLSWRKLDMLEKGMTAIPSMKPVKAYTYTSGYGVRYDPFSGSSAMHRGVDLAGPVGEPIYAAADGVIVEAGYNRGGYGNFVEIEHGAGIVTRYGHMSRIAVRKGDRIARGEMIGGMGSTGRSTGSHLHYEVLIDGGQVNPMPFLEASDYVLAVQDRASTAAVGGPATGR